jgi:hypothetical protein
LHIFLSEVSVLFPKKNAKNKVRTRTGQVPVTALELEYRRMLSASVTMFHNDLMSSGVNPNETLLTPSSVNVNTFGKQFSTPVDGQVYAQPLYIPNLNITSGNQQGIHNTVFVATEHDSLYAIDSIGGNILYQVSLLDVTNPKVNLIGATEITTMPASEVGTAAITVEQGITATPVIDQANGFIYVAASTRETINGGLPHYVQKLFKIDIHTGNILVSRIIADTIRVGPIQSFTAKQFTYRTTDTGTGTDPYVVGTGNGAITVNGQSRVYFNAYRQLNRGALTLWQGHIIDVFGAQADLPPYHGWVLMFDANTLTTQAVLNTSPNGTGAGIWQSGSGITIDDQGYMYLETGNGTFDYNDGIAMTPSGMQAKGNYGDCFLKIALDPTSVQTNQHGNLNGWGLKIVDYFSPFNNAILTAHDTDLGSGGVLLLPDSAGSTAHPHLLVGGGKEGKLYLIDRDNMGKFDPTTDRCVQTIGGAINGILNTPAYFNGQLFLFPGYSGKGRSYSLTNATIGAYQQSLDGIGNMDGTPSISANGTQNGIVWVIDRNGSLKAFDASDLTKRL